MAKPDVFTFIAQCAEQLAGSGRVAWIPVQKTSLPEFQMPAYGPRLLEYFERLGDIEHWDHIEWSEGGSEAPLFVFPLRAENRAIALLTVEFPPLSRPTHEALARLRRLCHAATPLLASLGEPVPDGRVDPSGLPDVQLAGLAQVHSHVLRNAVHDLRTPVMAIRGYVRLLLREQAGPLTGAQQEYLTRMLENAERMTGELNGVAELAQDRPVQLISVDLTRIWTNLVREVQAQALERSVRIEERFSHRPFLITADVEMLAQALGALLTRAVRQTADGGLAQISFDKGEDIIVTITAVDGRRIGADEAGGAPADELNALANARRAVRLQGGVVSISTNAGGGFTVIVRLPVISSKPEDVREQAFNTCRG